MSEVAKAFSQFAGVLTQRAQDMASEAEKATDPLSIMQYVAVAYALTDAARAAIKVSEAHEQPSSPPEPDHD